MTDIHIACGITIWLMLDQSLVLFLFTQVTKSLPVGLHIFDSQFPPESSTVQSLMSTSPVSWKPKIAFECFRNHISNLLPVLCTFSYFPSAAFHLTLSSKHKSDSLKIKHRLEFHEVFLPHNFLLTLIETNTPMDIFLLSHGWELCFSGNRTSKNFDFLRDFGKAFRQSP